MVGGEGVVIFSDTEYPQEAYDYLTHLCCSDFTQVFWDNWLTVPPQSAFADYYADDETYGDYIQVFSDQMDYSRTRPFTPSWPQIENAWASTCRATCSTRAMTPRPLWTLPLRRSTRSWPMKPRNTANNHGTPSEVAAI